MSWQPHDGGDFSSYTSSVTVVSDSIFNDLENKSADKDISGPLALETLIDVGITKANMDYLPDELTAIKAKIQTDSSMGVDFIIFLGGTGISKRDVTYEAVTALITKEIFGFGEEFRRRSIEQIGGFGMLSRAIAGVYNNSIVVALPGSPKATELGISLFLQFAGHAKRLVS